MRNKDATPPLDREYPYENEYENEVEKEPENAWPAWLQLSAGMVPIYVAPAISGFRPVAILGRSFAQPHITFRMFKRKSRNGHSWRDTGQGVSFSLQEFRVLLVKLNDVLTRRPELGEDRPIGGRT